MKRLLSYDLHGISSSETYKQIREDIEKAYPQSVYILNTTYIIKSSDSVDTMQVKIKAIMDKNISGSGRYEFIAVKYTDSQGWLNKGKWEKIRQIMNALVRRY